MAVSLNYGPAKTNIPLAEDNFYRAHGQEGLRDMQRTGVVRPAPANKVLYDEAYYNKGAPLDKYAARSGGGSIIEAAPNVKIAPAANAFPVTQQGAHVNMWEDPMRAYERTAAGVYENVHDNMNPIKRGLRTAAYNMFGHNPTRLLNAGVKAAGRYGPLLALTPVAAGLGAGLGTLNGGGSWQDAGQNALLEAGHNATMDLFR